MAFTYDFTTNWLLSVVRLLVADTDAAQPIWQDDEINAMITLTSSQSLYISGMASPTGAQVQVPTVPQVYSPYRAAALLLDSLASNKSRLSSVVKILDVQLSPEKAAANLRETANGYRYTEDHSGQFAIAEMVADQFSARERVWKMNQRLYS